MKLLVQCGSQDVRFTFDFTGIFIKTQAGRPAPTPHPHAEIVK